LSPAESDFAQRLAAVEDRIQRAAQRCGRKREAITLLAVSKKFPAERLRIKARRWLVWRPRAITSSATCNPTRRAWLPNYFK
jgi:hypothetical protein